MCHPLPCHSVDGFSVVVSHHARCTQLLSQHLEGGLCWLPKASKHTLLQPVPVISRCELGVGLTAATHSALLELGVIAEAADL